jgi:hypothetical protein
MRMNKERYNQIIDEAYKNYLIEDAKILPNMSKEKMTELGYRLTQEEFINICKTDTEFSERWGLKIVSRKLTNPERYKLWFSNNYQTGMEYNESNMPDFSDSYYEPTPTKLITITYNNKIIESYECN